MGNLQERMQQRRTFGVLQNQESWLIPPMATTEGQMAFAFEAISKLGVRDMLEEIKRDAWGERGNIEPFEKEWARGICLTYSYKEPDGGNHDYEVIGYKKKLSMGEWKNRAIETNFQDSGPRVTYEWREWHGPHFENIPIIEDHGIVYHMENKQTSLSVAFHYASMGRYYLDRNRYYLDVSDSLLDRRATLGGRHPFRSLPFNPIKIDYTSMATFLNEALLDACNERTDRKGLPNDIDTRVQRRVAQIPPSQLRYS
ncbi:MAG: hypothetical protein HYU48_00680 [Candidatus Levybacteria bacterium]|nr:hypothetical protein [Candidatus Levybacteria bacterium]